MKNLFNLAIASTLMVLVSLLGKANGHGMMIDPPSRSTMHDYGFNVPVNYDSNGLNCGGFAVRRQ